MRYIGDSVSFYLDWLIKPTSVSSRLFCARPLDVVRVEMLIIQTILLSWTIARGQGPSSLLDEFASFALELEESRSSVEERTTTSASWTMERKRTAESPAEGSLETVIRRRIEPTLNMDSLRQEILDKVASMTETERTKLVQAAFVPTQKPLASWQTFTRKIDRRSASKLEKRFISTVAPTNSSPPLDWRMLLGLWKRSGRFGSFEQLVKETMGALTNNTSPHCHKETCGCGLGVIAPTMNLTSFKTVTGKEFAYMDGLATLLAQQVARNETDLIVNVVSLLMDLEAPVYSIWRIAMSGLRNVSRNLRPRDIEAARTVEKFLTRETNDVTASFRLLQDGGIQVGPMEANPSKVKKNCLSWPPVRPKIWAFFASSRTSFTLQVTGAVR
jgi:hypothetical protein